MKAPHRKLAKVTSQKRPAASKPSTTMLAIAGFDEVAQLIEAARRQATRTVNLELIELYWKIGAIISRRIASDGWGQGTVRALSAYLSRTQRGQRGFSSQNLWRMRQFFEAYRAEPDLSTLVRELPWSANLRILSGTKRREEREFYLRMAIKEGWNVRELSRQIDLATFERSVMGSPKLSTALRELYPGAANELKDLYLLEFLDLAEEHSEGDLHRALLRNLGRFITELGRDFCFVGSEYPVQVGKHDFAIDLVFFHRALSCLIAVELKVREFRPEDLGKLSFYLEALDRNVKKPHERPSIGILLCATKDNEVVEYALSATLSPALVAEYQTVLPPRALLQEKLHEFYTQLATEEATPTMPGAGSSPPRSRRRTRANQRSSRKQGETSKR